MTITVGCGIECQRSGLLPILVPLRELTGHVLPVRPDGSIAHRQQKRCRKGASIDVLDKHVDDGNALDAVLGLHTRQISA